MIAQVAGITSVLTEAGMEAAVVHAWFQQPRRELGDLSPSTALEEIPTSQTAVLRLARADAAALICDLGVAR